jgi:hypothetical protein
MANGGERVGKKDIRPASSSTHACTKLTVPVRKVNTAVTIGAAVLLAPMLATLADATAAALLAFVGGKVAGAPVVVPEAKAVVPLLAQPEAPPAPQPVGPL